MKAKKLLRLFKHPQVLVLAVVVCLVGGGLYIAIKGNQLPNVPTKERPAASQAGKKAVSCAVVPCLALTFDDGPHPVTTPLLLDILAYEHVSATFFVVGNRVGSGVPVLQRMHAEGHEIGNHSWSHADLTTLPPKDVRAQIDTTQTALLEAGIPAPRLLRPPYGATNAVVEAHVPLTIVRWNIDPEDWLFKNPDDLATRIVQQAKPGGVLLLHDTYPHTLAAVQKALPQLKARYQLVTISELLGLSGGDQGQYFAR